MEQRKTSTKVAGVDVGKARLDAAVHDLDGWEEDPCLTVTDYDRAVLPVR